MNKCKSFISLAILVVLVSLSLYAQTSLSPLKSQSNIRFEHITVKDGLSQNHVTRILKDSKGFMWFCTQNGLNRYDGKSFKLYKHSPDDPKSLSNNHVQALYEDKSGTLWIGTYGGGVNKFERKTEKFTHYRHDPENNNSISSDFILSIYEDKSGFLWIGTSGSGINKFNMKEESFIHYSNNPEDPNSLSHNVVRAIYEDEAGIFWIGTDGGGLNKFDRRTGKFTFYKHNPANPKSLSHNFVLAIIEDQDDNLWLATGVGLVKFDRTTEIFTHPKPDPNDFTTNGIQYAECHPDLHLMSWNYPKRGNLQELITESGLYPLTTLKTLSSKDKQIFLKNNIVLCRDILKGGERLFNLLGISLDKLEGTIKEINKLLN